jgi:hypothetical protein
MKRFAYCIGLWILDCRGDILNPSAHQALLKVGAYDFGALIMDAAHGSQVLREPYIFELHANMTGSFSLNMNCFWEIRGHVDAREHVNFLCFLRQSDSPRAYLIYHDFLKS